MIIAQADRIIVEWAMKAGYACVYRHDGPADETLLVVVLDHAAAYFRQGRLIRVNCRKDGRHIDEMADELASVFAVCAYMELYEQHEQADDDKARVRRDSGAAAPDRTAPEDGETLPPNRVGAGPMPAPADRRSAQAAATLESRHK